MPVDMKKYQGVTLQDVEAEMARRKQVKSGLELSSFGQQASPMDAGTGIVNSFRTKAGLGAMEKPKGGDLSDILTALKIQQLMQPKGELPEGFIDLNWKTNQNPTIIFPF